MSDNTDNGIFVKKRFSLVGSDELEVANRLKNADSWYSTDEYDIFYNIEYGDITIQRDNNYNLEVQIGEGRDETRIWVFMKKYKNFCNALKNMEDITLYTEPYENIVMAGMVSLFGICFDQAWKSIGEILEHHGYTGAQTGSPKLIIKTAYQASMINDEAAWLEALVSRDNVAHAYNRSIALDIIHKSKAIYLSMFEELKQELERNWLES